MLPFLDCRTDFRFDYDLCMVIGLNSVNPELSRELVLQKLGNDGLRRVYQKTIERLFFLRRVPPFCVAMVSHSTGERVYFL